MNYSSFISGGRPEASKRNLNFFIEILEEIEEN